MYEIFCYQSKKTRLQPTGKPHNIRPIRFHSFEIIMYYVSVRSTVPKLINNSLAVTNHFKNSFQLNIALKFVLNKISVFSRSNWS